VILNQDLVTPHSFHDFVSKPRAGRAQAFDFGGKVLVAGRHRVGANASSGFRFPRAAWLCNYSKEIAKCRMFARKPAMR
jgi:hypothetical protein